VPFVRLILKGKKKEAEYRKKNEYVSKSSKIFVEQIKCRLMEGKVGMAARNVDVDKADFGNKVSDDIVVVKGEEEKGKSKKVGGAEKKKKNKKKK
jgi:hypothetical protein